MKIYTIILKIWRKIMAYINGREILFSSNFGNVSGEQPQLFAPTMSLSGDILTIPHNTSNGAFVTHYDILVNGEAKATVAVGDTFDLSTLGLASGEYVVTASARGTNFIASVNSNSVNYTVGSASGDYYPIVTNLKNVTADKTNATQASSADKLVTLKVTANTGYSLPSTIMITGCKSHSWQAYNDNQTGYLYLTEATGTVNIEITARERVYNITTDLTNVIADSSNTDSIGGALANYTATLKFTAADGYELPDSVLVSGCDYQWVKSTGTLYIENYKGDITITISGVSTEPIIYGGSYVATGYGADQDETNAYWLSLLKAAGVSLPCSIDFESGGIETAEIFNSDYSGYVCYGITFQNDGRMTFQLEDGEEVEAWEDGDDGLDVFIDIDSSTYPNGLLVDGNAYKAFNALFENKFS
jgi:hypothetical protein